MQQLRVIQSTLIYNQDSNQVSLVDLLLASLKRYSNPNLFVKTQIIVPNHATSKWLKDIIAKESGICCNYDFVVLPNPVLENIYKENNPEIEMFDFSQTKFIIYDYLCRQIEYDKSSPKIHRYICQDKRINKANAFQLALELEQIFHEYLYLRTEELINIENSNKIPSWQKRIWQHIINTIGNKKTFLDIYQYINQAKFILKLPYNLFIFGLTSIYPSQLKLIKQLSNFIPIYWFYLAISNEYYGDLLSNKAKEALARKTLHKPLLNADDLYLIDGNPLITNLGQQSREFLELLRANDIETYVSEDGRLKAEDRRQKNEGGIDQKKSCLDIIKGDIRDLIFRIKPEYRFTQNGNYYADPITLKVEENNLIYDLPNQELSIKINNCHNRMREVQVMFNEIVGTLNKNPELELTDILITAHDIDIYAPYISAVFDNETFTSHNGQVMKLLYNITGNRKNQQYSQLETLQLLINIPYHLPVSYLLDLINQTDIRQSLNISSTDIEAIKTWLRENNTHFGYDNKDYADYGYNNYQIHSFKQLLNNLILGAFIPNNVFEDNNKFPIYNIENENYIPYDNLDHEQIKLANKLMLLIELLIKTRDTLYIDQFNYNELSLNDAINLFSQLAKIIIHNEVSKLHYSNFLGNWSSISLQTHINLPIINQLITDYTSKIKNRISFDGSICGASMQYMRNIPFKIVCILGMNFGEFPRSSLTHNRLNILAHDWQIADRNYINEDKQTFLDIILGAQKQLIISYIGRKETDNSEIEPSPLLNLLLTTIGQSFTNFEAKDSIHYNYHNLLSKNSLHPFHNNLRVNFSNFWANINNSKNPNNFNCWDFLNPPQIDLTPTQQQLYYQPQLSTILKTFSFTNANLYNTLNIKTNLEIELEDYETLLIKDITLAKTLFAYFEKYHLKLNEGNKEDLYNFLTAKGIIGYKKLGQAQLEYYLDIYYNYIKLRGQNLANLELAINVLDKKGILHPLLIGDQVWLDDENNIIVCDDFHKLNSKSSAKVECIPLLLRIKSSLIYLMIKNNALIKLGNKITPNKVILRLIDSNTYTKFDFVPKLDSSIASLNILDKYLRYYLYSLTNPVLIHKPAINSYINKLIDKNNREKAEEEARKIFNDNYSNYDLESIKEDIIYSNVADHYFEFCKNNNVINHITTMGQIISTVKFESI